MTDFATPNLPSRDFDVTASFYRQLGFDETWRGDDWLILKRDNLMLEFFRYPDLDPATSAFSCCFRVADANILFDQAVSVGIPEKRTGWPRAHRPKPEPWGGIVGALIDPDGSLIRLVQSPAE